MNNEDKYIAIARMLETIEEKNNPYQKTWKMMEEMKDIEQFDTDLAWGRMMDKFTKEDLIPLKELKQKKPIRRRLMTIAASLILGLLVGTLYNSFMNKTTLIANNTQEVLIHTLADKSVVYLKPNSEITYDNHFNGKTRNISLKGEAFFKVKRNEALPFHVYAEEALVTVLGTSFNVRVNEESHQVEVLVKTGKVSLSGKNALVDGISLIPNEMGLFNAGALSKTKPEESNYLAWMDKKLIFKDAKLSKVINDLNRTYGINIGFENINVDSLSITSTYHDLNVDELVESLCLTLDLSYRKTKKSYILVSR
jgi:ferric-dicitrate binding protein FerR (iron transport regulator)